MMEKKFTIVSIDDREDDNYLLAHAVRTGEFPLDIRILHDGQEAIEHFQEIEEDEAQRGQAAPDLILLDLKMPRRNGFEVLDWIRDRKAFQHSPIAILTSSQAASDIQSAYDKGAEWYLVKPVKFDTLLQLIGIINEAIATQDPDLIRSSPCFRERGTKS